MFFRLTAFFLLSSAPAATLINRNHRRAWSICDSWPGSHRAERISPWGELSLDWRLCKLNKRHTTVQYLLGRENIDWKWLGVIKLVLKDNDCDSCVTHYVVEEEVLPKVLFLGEITSKSISMLCIIELGEASSVSWLHWGCWFNAWPCLSSSGLAS